MEDSRKEELKQLPQYKCAAEAVKEFVAEGRKLMPETNWAKGTTFRRFKDFKDERTEACFIVFAFVGMRGTPYTLDDDWRCTDGLVIDVAEELHTLCGLDRDLAVRALHDLVSINDAAYVRSLDEVLNQVEYTIQTRIEVGPEVQEP